MKASTQSAIKKTNYGIVLENCQKSPVINSAQKHIDCQKKTDCQKKSFVKEKSLDRSDDRF